MPRSGTADGHGHAADRLFFRMFRPCQPWPNVRRQGEEKSPWRGDGRPIQAQHAPMPAVWHTLGAARVCGHIRTDRTGWFATSTNRTPQQEKGAARGGPRPGQDTMCDGSYACMRRFGQEICI
jgi:hypothetical protein